MFPYFSVYSNSFSIYLLLNELKYLYIFLTIHFMHTVNFSTENFVSCYLLALG